MSILFDEDSSSFGPTSADPMLAGINGATDELRFASAIETGTEGPEDEVLKAAGSDNGVDELLVPQNGPGALNVGKSGAEILEDSSGGKSPPGEKDTLTGEEDDVVIGEADSLTGGSSEREEISPRSGLRDARNNSISSAYNIGTLSGSRSFSDFVGTTDTNDYYRFYLSGEREFDLTLNGLSGDADVQLLNSSGSVITSSTRGGTSADSISRTLDSGTYYIRVYPMSGVNTNYNLSMSAESVAPDDYAGNTMSNARNLNTLSGNRSFSDFVGTADSNDYYRFYLSGERELDLTLNGLSGDADVQLLNSSGSVITRSTRGGTSADSISRTLDSGTYYIRVYPMSGVNTNYNLSLSAESVAPPDGAGNSMSNARNLNTLSGNRSFSDFVGTADSNDYYRFYLSGERELDLTLNGLSGDADVQLLNSSGSVITRSTRGGTSADSISRTLDSGTYYIRVYPMSGVNTNYNLSLSAESVAPPDGAGNSMSNARNLNTLSGNRSFSDFVGTADSNDYYRFYLSGERELDLTLNGLSGDADVQLLNSSGSVITSSTRGGTSADSISRTLDSGTYYIRVYPMSGVNTNYNLSLSAESVAPPDGAGNSMSSARNLSTLSGSRSFRDFVGTADTNDYYRFYLSGERELDLTLNGLSGDADVQLLNSSGSVITSSTRGGTSADSISRTLDSGTYYIRVYPMSGVNTNYNLSLSAESVAPPDGAGNSMSSARNLSTLSGSRSFSDFVGTADTNDHYRFYLSGERELDLTLNGLSGDADVQLLNSSGSVITSSTRGGTSADSISRTLDSGTYYIRVYPMSGVNTNYNLSLSAESVAPPDGAGNSMSSARNLSTLSGSRSFSDFVGTADTNDYYRFYLSGERELDLTLNGLSGDADVQLLNSSGSVITSSTRGGTSADSISRTLDSGTYYIRVYPMSGVNTNYNLSLSAESVAPPDGAGNSMSSARNLSTLSGSRSFSDFVGTADSNDYYRFYLSGERELDLTLNGLSGDADVQLLNSSGSVITRSTRGGTSADSISRTLDSGTYYIRVYPMSGVNTNYNLSLSAESVIPADPVGNTMSNARNLNTLNGSRSFSDFVGTTDTNDYYRFYLSNDSDFSLTLNGLSGDADVRLLDSGGNTVASSRRGGTSADTISEELDSGTYYVRIYPMSGVNTNYNLSISAESTTPPGGGNTLGTARNIGSLSGSRSFRDSVSSSDTNDFYRFEVNRSGILTADLTGLSGDADVRLIKDRDNDRQIDRGEIEAWQWERGSGSESIRKFVTPGTYFLQVNSYRSQSANYNLTTNFSAGSDNRQFSIDINFVRGSGALTSQMRNAVEEAASFWENVVSHSSLNSNHRLTIDVGGEDQGGRNRNSGITLASAGPRSSRPDANGSRKPTSGVANVNTNQDALEVLSDINYFKGVMIHEFGHVLGIGTHWDRNNLRSRDTYNANTDAGWAYGELLGTFRPTAIPLTTGVGGGSDYSHWREQVFGNEIMTHAANRNYPLSQMTIASLRDMGWNVNYGAADNYSLPQRNVRNPRNGDRVEYLW